MGCTYSTCGRDQIADKIEVGKPRRGNPLRGMAVGSSKIKLSLGMCATQAAPVAFNHGKMWRCVVSFAPRPLCAVVRALVPTASLHVLQVRCLLCRESNHDYSIIQPTVYSLSF